jgi:hypothetical protein
LDSLIEINLLLLTIQLVDRRVPAPDVVHFLVVLPSRPPTLFGRRPLQRFLHGLLESTRLIRSEVVVGIPYLIEGALDHELVIAV